MNLSKSDQRWFFPAQNEAMKELEKQYESLPCNFQVFDNENDRIIEQYQGINPDKPVVTIEVHYRKRGVNEASVLIYELNFKQGWSSGKEK